MHRALYTPSVLLGDEEHLEKASDCSARCQQWDEEKAEWVRKHDTEFSSTCLFIPHQPEFRGKTAIRLVSKGRLH